jgi:hypothetical protein
VIEQGDNDIDMIDLAQIKSMKPKNLLQHLFMFEERAIYRRSWCYFD